MTAQRRSALNAGWLRQEYRHTLRMLNTYWFSGGNNGYANAAQCYLIRALSVLYCLYSSTNLSTKLLKNVSGFIIIIVAFLEDNVNINLRKISLVLRRWAKLTRVQWRVLVLNVKMSTNVSIRTIFDIGWTRRASELETLVGSAAAVYFTAHTRLQQWLGPWTTGCHTLT